MKIIDVEVRDLRFPTSLTLDGSDAMNKDGDYSATYVTIRTDNPDFSGFGFTFTIGRGNDICVLATQERAKPLIGLEFDDLKASLGEIYRKLSGDSQIRWLGPDKGVVHLALAAVMNALWDLAARIDGKPLWKLLSDMPPEQLVEQLDFTYLTDAITKTEAVEMLRSAIPHKSERLTFLLERGGYPCYTTSAGWLGYDDETLKRLLREAVADGYQHFKLKVGANLNEDRRRLKIAREVIGWDANLMIDANQVWDVPEAIEWVKELAEYKPLWIEEPTSPDDVLGHATIRKAVAPIGVATGEHGMNRVLFKQMFQAGAFDYCQIDSARMASINEILPVYFMAKKFDIPVCPHAGGVGLCELVQHLSIFDYLAVAGTLENRVTEFVDHLHEHFTDPCVVVSGSYTIPTEPGYSAEIHESSIDEYEFPTGTFWQDHLKAKQK